MSPSVSPSFTPIPEITGEEDKLDLTYEGVPTTAYLYPDRYTYGEHVEYGDHIMYGGRSRTATYIISEEMNINKEVKT